MRARRAGAGYAIRASAGPCAIDHEPMVVRAPSKPGRERTSARHRRARLAAARPPARSSSAAIGPFQATSAPPIRSSGKRVLRQDGQRRAGAGRDQVELLAVRRVPAEDLRSLGDHRHVARVPVRRRSRAAHRPSCRTESTSSHETRGGRGRARCPARHRRSRGRAPAAAASASSSGQRAQRVEQVEARHLGGLDDARQVDPCVGGEEELDVALARHRRSRVGASPEWRAHRSRAGSSSARRAVTASDTKMLLRMAFRSSHRMIGVAAGSRIGPESSAVTVLGHPQKQDLHPTSAQAVDHNRSYPPFARMSPNCG